MGKVCLNSEETVLQISTRYLQSVHSVFVSTHVFSWLCPKSSIDQLSDLPTFNHLEGALEIIESNQLILHIYLFIQQTFTDHSSDQSWGYESALGFIVIAVIVVLWNMFIMCLFELVLFTKWQPKKDERPLRLTNCYWPLFSQLCCEFILSSTHHGSHNVSSTIIYRFD